MITLLWLLPLLLGLAWYCCCEPQCLSCGYCIGGNTPFEFSIVIANVSNGTCQCDAMNGTWIVENPCNPGSCAWTYNFSAAELAAIETQNGATCTDCNANGSVVLSIVELNPTTGKLDVQIGCSTTSPAGGVGITWRNTFPAPGIGVFGPIDCMNLSSYSVTLLTGGAGQCLRNSATCNVTTL